MNILSGIKSKNLIVLYVLFSLLVLGESFRFAFSFNTKIVEGGTYYDTWIWIYGASVIVIAMGFVWQVLLLTKNVFFAEIALCFLFCTWYFIFFQSDITIDDGGIVLKYLDNAKKGFFYTYNIGDDPVWGISGFLHGLLCVSIAMFTPLSSFDTLMCANFIGLFFLCWALFRFVSNYVKDPIFIYIYWISGLLISFRLVVCGKQGLETGLHVGLLFLTFHLFFNRNKNTNLLIIAWVLCLISKLDSAPLVAIMGIWFLYENREKLIAPEKKLYMGFLIYGIIPGILWLLISSKLFGGPIPQTAIAKQFSQHTFGPGFRFISIFFDNRPKLWVLLSSVFIMGFFSRKVLIQKYGQICRPDTYYLPVLLFIGYFVLYYFYNPIEAMLWYYIVPDLLFIYIIIYNVNLIFDLVSITVRITDGNKKVIVACVFISCFIFCSNKVAKDIGAFWYTRRVQERTFKEVGRYVKRHANQTDTLLCGHGYPAREAGLYNVDISGLNFKGTTDLNFMYADIVKKYHPHWIVSINSFNDLCNGNNQDVVWIQHNYSLVKTYTIDYRSEILQYPVVLDYTIWKRNIGTNN